MSHHRYRNGNSSTAAEESTDPRLSDYFRDLQVFVELTVESGCSVHVPEVMVVRHPGEKVMAARGDIDAVRPLLALQGHVALFLLPHQVVKEHRHAVAGGVLQRERDEDEAHAELTELVPGDGILLVLPLERGRVVEREARLGKALADLGAELLGRPTVGGRELAPQQVRNTAVHIAKAALDGELYPALALRRLGR